MYGWPKANSMADRACRIRALFSCLLHSFLVTRLNICIARLRQIRLPPFLYPPFLYKVLEFLLVCLLISYQNGHFGSGLCWSPGLQLSFTVDYYFLQSSDYSLTIWIEKAHPLSGPSQSFCGSERNTPHLSLLCEFSKYYLGSRVIGLVF